MASSIDIVLVGRELAGEENLGLRYVAGALVAAGHSVHVHSLNALSEVPSVASQVLKLEPSMVGIGLSDPNSCVDHLVLSRYLRQVGFHGHIVAGGAFATLARHELLERHPEIDSIIRHAGERPAVELAMRLATGVDWRGSPGLTTRSGDGAACVPSLEPFPNRPLRTERLQHVLGVPVARILASRGCNGSCRYCGSSALRRMAIREGRQAALPMADLKRAGVGARQRRPVADVADEISELYHQRGVRVLQVLDDNLVGDTRDESLAYVTQLKEQLRDRGVGRMAMTLMIDPDSVSVPMLRELKSLGIVRLFIGVESLTELGARALGRTAHPESARHAIELSRGEGMETVFNDIIVHPNATAASITAELDGLARVPSGVYFEVNPLLVYPMTDLYSTLRNQGRLHGGILGCEYEPGDVVARRFHATLIRFAMALSASDEPALYVHRVSLSVAVARHLGLGRYSPGLDENMRGLLDECNRVRLRLLRAALALSQTELPASDRERCAQAMIAEGIRDLSDLAQRSRAVQRFLDPTLVPGLEHHNLLIARATRSLLVVSLGAALACGGKTSQDPYATTGTGGLSASGQGGAASLTGGSPSAGGTTARITGTTVTLLDPCGNEITHWRAQGATTVDCPPTIACDLEQTQNSSPAGCAFDKAYHLYIDTNGVVADVIAADGSAVDPTLKQCVIDALANERFPCLSGHEVWGTVPVIII